MPVSFSPIILWTSLSKSVDLCITKNILHLNDCLIFADSAMCSLSCWIQLCKHHTASGALCSWVLFPSRCRILYRMWSWTSLYWPCPVTKTLSKWNLQPEGYYYYYYFIIFFFFLLLFLLLKPPKSVPCSNPLLANWSSPLQLEFLKIVLIFFIL